MLDKLLKAGEQPQAQDGKVDLSSPHMQAKMDLLRDLRKMAMGMMADGHEEPKDMQATMILAKGKPEDMKDMEDCLPGEEGSPAEEAKESPEEEKQEDAKDLQPGEMKQYPSSDEDSEDESSEEPAQAGDESPEALKARIKELEAKLASK